MMLAGLVHSAVVSRPTITMQQPVSVGRSFASWPWIASLVATAVLGVIGAVLLADGEDAAIPLLALCGLCAAGSVVGAAVIALGRRSVSITPAGFAVHDRRGTRGFRDEQVICVTLVRKNNFSSGVLKSVTRKFLVWVEAEDGTELISMVNRVKVGQDDPLAPLIDRLHALLLDRARNQLESGQPFDGEGWTLERDELVVAEGKRQSRTFVIPDLSAAGVFDDKVCVWERGRDEPVVRVPLETANALVLHDLLQERIPRAAESDSPRGDSLGRILFQRPPSGLSKFLLWLVGFAAAGATLTLVGVILGLIFGDNPPPLGMIGTVTLICGGAWLVWLLIYSSRATLRCHEHGVCKQTPFREDRLRYDEVGTFTYNAIRQFVNGVYTGTTLTLKFHPLDPSRRKISYSANLRNADAELDNLRDHISGVIARRMVAEHLAGQEVPWTSHLRFVPEGLEYRPASLLGRREPKVARLDEISGMDLNQGYFNLWVGGQKKAAISESVSQPNFFPGFVALVTLLNMPRTTDVAEAEVVE